MDIPSTSSRIKSKQFWTQSIRFKIALPLFGGIFLFAAIAVYLGYNNQLKVAEAQAVAQAKSIISQMISTRAIYTDNVIVKLREDDIDVQASDDFATESGHIPIPATLLHLISNHINEQNLYTVDLVSPWPINPNRGPQTEWQTSAIQQLINDPQADARIVESNNGGESHLVYMSVDFASTESCVNCHNAHPDSPKTDFEVGDMMGALVVDIPLTDQFEVAQKAALQTGLLILIGLIGLGALFLFTQQRFILQPVSQLITASQRMAAGDLTIDPTIESADELGILGASFNQMAAQLQQTVSKIERRNRAIEAGAQVSRYLSTILDPQKLVTAVVEQVQMTFNYYHVHIYLWDDTTQQLVVAGGTGEAGAVMLSMAHTLTLGQGLVGQTAVSNQSILVPDVSLEAGWLPNALLPDTKAETAVPISIGDKVLGVLDVQHNIVGGLLQSDVELLESIADQVAIALQNVTLFEKTHQQADQEILINSISEKIENATTMEDILDVAARELQQAFAAQRTIVELSADSLRNGHN